MKRLSDILPDNKRLAAIAAAAALFFSLPFAASAVARCEMPLVAAFCFDEPSEMPWHFSAFTGIVRTFFPDNLTHPFIVMINGKSLSDRLKEFFGLGDEYNKDGLLNKDAPGTYTL